MRDRAIEEVLAGLGLAGEAAERGRAVLEAAHLTRPGKQRIAEAKIGAAREAIDAALTRLCATCSQRTADGREVVVVPAESCTACRGSANARALRELEDECRAADVHRLVFVGGSPSFRAELERLADGIELRLVDGTERRTSAEARSDFAWADAVVVCGATELDHKVSKLYVRNGAARDRVIVTSRRGIAAIASELTRHLRTRSGRGTGAR